MAAGAAGSGGGGGGRRLALNFSKSLPKTSLALIWRGQSQYWNARHAESKLTISSSSLSNAELKATVHEGILGLETTLS